MKRFFLSEAAQRDLTEIRDHHRQVPIASASEVARKLQQTIYPITADPYLGQAHSAFTRLLGEEVRSRLSGSYRIYYRFTRNHPEIIAILHGTRDTDSLLRARLT